MIDSARKRPWAYVSRDQNKQSQFLFSLLTTTIRLLNQMDSLQCYIFICILDLENRNLLFNHPLAQLFRAYISSLLQFWLSNDVATFQVRRLHNHLGGLPHLFHLFDRQRILHFRMHKHFLVTYSSVFRDLFRRQTGNSNSSDNKKPNENDHIIHLDGVTILEFESLLTFFYEGYSNVQCTCSILRVAVLFRFLMFLFPVDKRVSQYPL